MTCGAVNRIVSSYADTQTSTRKVHAHPRQRAVAGPEGEAVSRLLRCLSSLDPRGAAGWAAQRERDRRDHGAHSAERVQPPGMPARLRTSSGRRWRRKSSSAPATRIRSRPRSGTPRAPGSVGLLRTLRGGRRIVAILLALALSFSASEVALADVGDAGAPRVATASAPTGDLPSPDAECPPACACPCLCVCRGPGAVLPTVLVSEVDEVWTRRPAPIPTSMPAINAPKPLLRPPLV